MQDMELQLDNPGQMACFSPKSPQGHEPGHDIIHAPELWSMGYTGYGRKVLILDSGVDSGHPALYDQYAGNYMADSLAWFDPEGETNEPVSCGVHGSQVAGIILGLDKQTKDTTGVAFESLWMASPVAPNPGQCQATNAIAALQWALNPDGDSTTSQDMPDVINNSWSLINPAPGQECESIFRDVLEVLEIAGIAVIWSAGNQGPGFSTIASPKNINTNPVNAFCVGAIRGSVNGFPIFPNSSRGPSRCQLSADTIKPEVVAPGANIRSCGLNGNYISSSGTSFSTPHVSGAFLLLKEAFPSLSGKDLLMALYLSAQDLGQVGEDNLYGRGLINVGDAYQYLLGQGNTPVQVTDSNDVAIRDLQTGQPSPCDSFISPSFHLANQGTDSLEEVWIIWQYSQGLEDSLHWTGKLPPDSQAHIVLPVFSPPIYGHFSLNVQLSMPNGTPDYHYLDNRQFVRFSFLPLPPAVFIPDTVCIGKNALLRASADTGEIIWFSDSTSVIPINRGELLLTGAIQNDTSFFVAQEINNLTGCKTGIDLSVVPGQVQASFNMSDSVVYLAQSGHIQFANLSTGAGKWAWDFGDGNGSVLASPAHNYTQPGTFVVSLWAGNDECGDATVDTVTVLSWALQSVSFTDNKITVSPNPCQTPCKIRLQAARPVTAQVYLSNIQGQILKSWNKSFSATADLRLNIHDLPPGFYFLRVKTNTYTNSFRIHLL